MSGIAGYTPRTGRFARPGPIRPPNATSIGPSYRPARGGPQSWAGGQRWQHHSSKPADHAHRCQAVKSAPSAGAAAQQVLAARQLVLYQKEQKHLLAVLIEPDGKRNWWSTDERGRKFSLPQRAVSLVLPGSGYSADDLTRFSTAAADADASLLEIAWAVAAEDSRSYSLPELSRLLFDDEAAINLFVTFSMLLADRVFFKQTFKAGVWSFEPQAADAVEAAQAAAAAEAAAAAACEQFISDFNAARAAAAKARPADVAALQAQWLAGPHAERVAALMDFACKSPAKCPQASEALARETLSTLFKRRPEPDVAAGLLMEAGLLRLHEPLPLLRAGRSAGQEFPPALEAAARALLASPPPDPDAESRRCLTHLRVFTIDDACTTEVDDGLSVETDGDGHLLLWIHVADPTRFITPGDVLDVEARSRSRSLYLPFGSVPMFPGCLSEGPFSLTSDSIQEQQQQPCCAVSVCAALAEDGSLARLVCVTPSSIRVAHRMTYDEADADLALGPGMCQHEDLQALYDAARLRRGWRVSQGCIDIDLPEAKLEVAPDQLDSPTPAITCTKISQWESAARLMVAEMMILAGEAVGRLGADAGLPLPFRGQEAPSLPAAEALAGLDGPCRGYALRRCMTRSVIEPAPVRHASLALDAYVQFTSPIRRYSDLMAHWNLKAHLRGQPPPFPAGAITSITAAAGESARELGRAEGDVNKSWAAELLRQRGITRSWEGVVLGWFRAEMSLAAVSLEELGLETIVKVEFPVSPGDRLLLRLAEADVRSGFFRMYVHDRAGPPPAATQPAWHTDDERQQQDEQQQEEDEQEHGAGAGTRAISWRSQDAAGAGGDSSDSGASDQGVAVASSSSASSDEGEAAAGDDDEGRLAARPGADAAAARSSEQLLAAGAGGGG